MALARKAARGAGYSWSMADEAAFATSWLCRNGVDGTSLIATHLKIAHELGADSIKLQSLQLPWTGSSDGLCALSAGASISDLATSIQSDEMQLQQIIGAALLLPYVALASQRVQHDSSSSAHRVCTTRVKCEHFDATLHATPTSSWLSEIEHHHIQTEQGYTDVFVNFNLQSNPVADTQSRLHTAVHRANIAAETLADLERFAAKTYAPATSASRQGAGAGETDND